MLRDGVVKSSFRDPSGFLFVQDGVLYRQVNKICKEDYDKLIESGLYQELVDKKLLVPHEEAGPELAQSDLAYKVIRPEELNFVSYPYEWCFSQLKDAALNTLKIQKIALGHGMGLKDANAYNMQFHGGRPVLIDTLSFEVYKEGSPWVAYKQFCQHFLAPLALASYTDVRLNSLLRAHIDGVPLDLASKLLPLRSRFSATILFHIHLHSGSQKRHADSGDAGALKKAQLSKGALVRLMDTLIAAVSRLRWTPKGTEWGEYYEDTNYSDTAQEHKKEIVDEMLDAVGPGSVWDMGGNTGLFSRIASDKGISTVSFDVDPAAIEKSYRESKKRKESNLLALVQDLTNPSPSLGWAHSERDSLLARGPADMVLALALVHHLAISNNVPLDKLAEFFADLARSLVIEFVPKSDSQVKRLLATREDVFPRYDRENFERAFEKLFSIEQSIPVKESERTIYLMKLK